MEKPITNNQILSKIDAMFNQIYAITNSTDRVTDTMESGSWCAEATDLEHFLSLAYSMFKDCDLTGIILDDPR